MLSALSWANITKGAFLTRGGSSLVLVVSLRAPHGLETELAGTEGTARAEGEADGGLLVEITMVASGAMVDPADFHPARRRVSGLIREREVNSEGSLARVEPRGVAGSGAREFGSAGYRKSIKAGVDSGGGGDFNGASVAGCHTEGGNIDNEWISSDVVVNSRGRVELGDEELVESGLERRGGELCPLYSSIITDGEEYLSDFPRYLERVEVTENVRGIIEDHPLGGDSIVATQQRRGLVEVVAPNTH